MDLPPSSAIDRVNAVPLVIWLVATATWTFETGTRLRAEAEDVAEISGFAQLDKRAAEIRREAACAIAAPLSSWTRNGASGHDHETIRVRLRAAVLSTNRPPRH